MNDALNKLFGRDFLIGFFLPALLFILSTCFLLKNWGFTSELLNVDLTRPLADAGFVLIASLLLAIFLEAFNREIFRIAEGYWWPLWLRRRLAFLHVWRFRNLQRKIDQVGKGEITLSRNERALLLRRAAMAYPSTEDQVLPTSFGNAVRAYEDYARVIYGFESIDGWARLQALMSKEFREILGSSRARVDLWLNLATLALLFLIEAFLLADNGNRSVNLWLLLSVLLAAAFAYLRARSSVQEYGHSVKAAFDLYLPALAAQLGYVPSKVVAHNRKFWVAFSRLIVFRHTPQLQEMVGAGLATLPRPKESASAESTEAASD